MNLAVTYDGHNDSACRAWLAEHTGSPEAFVVASVVTEGQTECATIYSAAFRQWWPVPVGATIGLADDGSAWLSVDVIDGDQHYRRVYRLTGDVSFAREGARWWSL